MNKAAAIFMGAAVAANLYLVDAGEVYFGGSETEPGETGRAIELVRALTRSQAQYLMWRETLTREGDLHEFNYRTLLLERGVTGDPGAVPAGDPLFRRGWELADRYNGELRPWQKN